MKSKDGTKKYLLKLYDDNIVECVFLTQDYGNTICMSTQVGCRMGCKFCASTLNGRVRDLTAGEMLSTIAVVNADNGKKTEKHRTRKNSLCSRSASTYHRNNRKKLHALCNERYYFPCDSRD